jgi:hypothetical protein
MHEQTTKEVESEKWSENSAFEMNPDPAAFFAIEERRDSLWERGRQGSVLEGILEGMGVSKMDTEWMTGEYTQEQGGKYKIMRVKTQTDKDADSLVGMIIHTVDYVLGMHDGRHPSGRGHGRSERNPSGEPVLQVEESRGHIQRVQKHEGGAWHLPHFSERIQNSGGRWVCEKIAGDRKRYKHSPGGHHLPQMVDQHELTGTRDCNPPSTCRTTTTLHGITTTIIPTTTTIKTDTTSTRTRTTPIPNQRRPRHVSQHVRPVRGASQH